MMFEALFCVDTDTVTVMLCDSFIFGSLAIWVSDDIESKVTKLNFCFQSVSLHYVTKNNVNDVGPLTKAFIFYFSLMIDAY